MYWNSLNFPNASRKLSGLIETWDVLKYTNIFNGSMAYLINRNMRCIEMPTKKTTKHKSND